MSRFQAVPAAFLASAILLVGCAGDSAAPTDPTGTDAAVSQAPVLPTLVPAASEPAAPPTPAPTPGTMATDAAMQTGGSVALDTQPLGGLTGSVGTVAGDQPRPAPRLTGLLASDGSAFDLAALRGDPTLLFFGYTHCPDVCPATIGELFGVFEARPDVRAVFVSIDPQRDTVEFLDEWTQYFPENFDALTGTPGAVRRAADDYGVRYARVETSSTTGYTMSHTADVFLIDASGQLLRSFPFGARAEEIVADISRLEAG